MMTHPCQSNGRSTKQTKLYCFRGLHVGMCHTKVWLCIQMRTIGHLCIFQGNRPCCHLPEKKHMHPSKIKGNTTNKGSKMRRDSLEKWRTSGQGGYITPAALGIPTASERGAKSEVAHKWARWLHHPCHLGDPHRFKAGGKIRSGPQVGKVATSPLPPRGSPPLQSGGQNQKWPIHGQGGYITPAASGINTASKRGAKSEVAHKWARWLHHPCHLGDPHRFKAGGKIRSGPYMGKVATSPLPPWGSPPLQSVPPRGSPPLQSGGQNQKWPIHGQGGYITLAASGIATASKRGAKSEVAHK